MVRNPLPTRSRDPQMPLTDIQWILGHARLSTTQVYLTPVPGDVIAAVTAFHARRAQPAPRQPRLQQQRKPPHKRKTKCHERSGLDLSRTGHARNQVEFRIFAR